MTPPGKPRACIVLPTYNEAPNVPIIVPAIFEQAANIPTHELHVLVVDDRSPDGTADEVRKLQARFPNLHLMEGEKAGLGEAYKRGMKHAIDTLDPHLIFEMDADLQHDPKLLPLFVSLGHHGFGLVIGSRFAPGGSTPDFSLYRRTISLVGNSMIRILGGIPRIHDCTSGYRCIHADLIKKADLSYLSTRGYSFQASLLCELLRQGARVVEIPIVFPDRQHGDSKLTLQDQVEFLTNIARIRFRQSKEFIKFCIVGLSGVFVNLGAYLLLTRVAGWRLEFASPAAIELSILSNFVLNSLWTFRDRNTNGSWLSRLLRFHLVASAGGVTTYLVLLGLVRGFGMWDVLANLFGIAVGTVVNYSMNSLWTWKKIEDETSASG